MGTRTMRRSLRLLAPLVALVLLYGAHGVQRSESEQEPDIPMEPTLPKSQTQANSIPAGNMQFSDKIPRHLAEHYKKNGLDGVVYFSFCIAWYAMIVSRAPRRSPCVIPLKLTFSLHRVYRQYKKHFMDLQHQLR